MKNNFVVSACRFHTKDNKKLLVAGYFEEDAIGDNQIRAQ